jgi:hypothetical protein
MNIDMQRRALAARDAHLALVDLRRVVDEAAQRTHAAELEAVHLAMSPRKHGDISSQLRSVIERLGSDAFQDSLSRARQSLQSAISGTRQDLT